MKHAGEYQVIKEFTFRLNLGAANVIQVKALDMYL